MSHACTLHNDGVGLWRYRMFDINAAIELSPNAFIWSAVQFIVRADDWQILQDYTHGMSAASDIMEWY